MKREYSTNYRNSLSRTAAALGTLFLAGCGPSATATDAKPAPPPPVLKPIAIGLVDDPTDPKIPTALNEQTAAQLKGLFDIAGAESVQIGYHLVQEKVEQPVFLLLSGWSAPTLPAPPSDALPFEKHQRETKKFMAAVIAGRQSRADWQANASIKLEGFLHDASSAQQSLAQRWAAVFNRRGMVDFRRSSVADTIVAAAKTLPATTSHSFLVLATDFVDEPPGKMGRKTPFTAIEVPPHIHLIFLTADGNIPRSPLIKEMKNPTIVAKDLTGAVEYIKKIVNEPKSNGSLVTTARP